MGLRDPFPLGFRVTEGGDIVDVTPEFRASVDEVVALIRRAEATGDWGPVVQFANRDAENP